MGTPVQERLGNPKLVGFTAKPTRESPCPMAIGLSEIALGGLGVDASLPQRFHLGLSLVQPRGGLGVGRFGDL